MKQFNQFFDEYMKKVTDKNLPEKEVEKGEGVEQEHIAPKKRKTKTGKKLARTIASHHLSSNPRY